MVDINLRRVKRTKEGFKLLTDAQQETLTGDVICNHCCQQRQCTILMTLEKTVPKAKSVVVMCDQYRIPIKFQDTTGTDLPTWNTVRLGTAFTHRVQIGDVVGLINKRDRLYGYVRVTGMDSGEIGRMMRMHAAANHMIADQALDARVATERLEKVLRTAYGNLVFENATEASVLYMQRLAILGKECR